MKSKIALWSWMIGWLASNVLFNMIQAVSILVIGLLGAGCDLSITDYQAFPSPDKTKSIIVIEELQAANDPAPWWTHVSLREGGKGMRKIPGNLLKLKGRGQIIAKWSDTNTVFIQIDDKLWVEHSIASDLVRNSVTIEFISLADLKGGISVYTVSRKKLG